MNFRKAFLVLGLFLAYTYSSFAETHLDNELDVVSFLSSSKVIENKIYLQPGTVYVAPDQILLNVKGLLLPIGNLSADAEGIFVTIDELVMAVRNGTWKCSKCQATNSIEERWCIKCGNYWRD